MTDTTRRPGVADGRILVTRRLPPGGLDPVSGHTIVGPKADDTPYSRDELVALAGEVDAIVCLLTDRIDASVLAAGAGRLRIVANVAVGYDNIDLRAAAEHGVMVCNTPGVLDETTADLAFLLVLAASRLATTAENDLRSGRWTGWGINDHLGRDVHGATLGVVGYGRIGRAVARRATGFGDARAAPCAQRHRRSRIRRRSRLPAGRGRHRLAPRTRRP